MKGRTVNEEQKRFHDQLCQRVGCVVCWVCHGHFTDYCSIHHIDGRTRDHAHWYVLPLCAGHHQHGTGPDSGRMMTGRHATLREGGKQAFEARYGSEDLLFVRCFEQLHRHGVVVPRAARMTLASLLEREDVALPLNFGHWVYAFDRDIPEGHTEVFQQ